MKAWAAAAALLASLPASGAIEPASYRARLERIDAHLARGDPQAAAEAGALAAEQVRWGAETLPADATVLGPIAKGGKHRGPLQKLIAALPGAPPRTQPAAADHARLERLRAQQAEREIAKGGALPGSPVKKLSFFDQLAEWLFTAGSWIEDRLAELWAWLKKVLFPKRTAAAAGVGGAALNVAVYALVGAMLAVIVAFALRAARGGPAAPIGPRSSAPRRDHDEDPLSRGVNEWEERAQALAAEGRSREAIRAWYHALLVASFRRGVLHHRRGRTNREYAAALPADVAWRARFAELTGRFDVEWYGHAESAPEALHAFAEGARHILRDLRGPA